jgi:hypothetical protein
VLLAGSLPWGALLAPANLRVAVAALVVLTGLTVVSYDGVRRLRSEGPA